MILGESIPELVECVDPKTFRVYAPTPVLFLCGGPTSIELKELRSMRDAFLRVSHKRPFDRFNTILAEDLNPFFPKGTYKDILSLESDVAQISELIVLFSESFGSAAELGAFAMVDEIAHRLLVVIDDENYDTKSFIKYGPIKSLEVRYGNTAICVLSKKELNIPNINNVKNMNLVVFSERLASAIQIRSNIYRERTTFNPQRNGHLIKFIVGIVQHYGALTSDEINVILYCLNISISIEEINNLLLCAEFVDWISTVRRGVEIYHVAVASKEALQFKVTVKNPNLERLRWRALISEFWKNNDINRFNAIQDTMKQIL